jgi:hypothetical protein
VVNSSYHAKCACFSTIRFSVAVLHKAFVTPLL